MRGEEEEGGGKKEGRGGRGGGEKGRGGRGGGEKGKRRKRERGEKGRKRGERENSQTTKASWTIIMVSTFQNTMVKIITDKNYIPKHMVRIYHPV